MNIRDGFELKIYRKALGLSQRAMDRKLGFFAGAVSRWESGKRKISPQSLYRINQIIGEKKIRNRSLWQRIKDWIF